MKRPQSTLPASTPEDPTRPRTPLRSRPWLPAVSAVALVVVLVLAGTVALKALDVGILAPAPTPTAVPFVTLGHLAQLNAEWLDPASPFSQQAQQQLDTIGRHAGQSLTFQTGYDYTISDTDGYPHVHEGYYVTLGVFAVAGHDYVTVGAVTVRGMRTPLTFSLSNLPSLHQVVQNGQGTYPASGLTADIAPAALLAFLGQSGHIVGLDLITSQFYPNVQPIISALVGERATSGLVPFELPAAGQTLNPADYPNPTLVYTFPPYSTPPASALATPPGQTTPSSSAPGGPTSAAATITMSSLNFAGPTSVTIQAGKAVLFDDPVASGGFHSLVTGTHGAFTAMAGAPSQFTSTGIMFSPGTRMVIVFPAAGTFTITCTLHPSMLATVIVTPASVY